MSAFLSGFAHSYESVCLRSTSGGGRMSDNEVIRGTIMDERVVRKRENSYSVCARERAK